MTKQEKIEKVKDLLNQVLIICGTNQDEFLLEVSETIQSLLNDTKEINDSEKHFDMHN